MINNSTQFLHEFFFSGETYSADAIERKVPEFIIQSCLQEGYVRLEEKNGQRLYRILPAGKKIVG